MHENILYLFLNHSSLPTPSNFNFRLSIYNYITITLFYEIGFDMSIDE